MSKSAKDALIFMIMFACGIVSFIGMGIFGAERNWLGFFILSPIWVFLIPCAILKDGGGWRGALFVLCITVFIWSAIIAGLRV